jgi:hypothetical protein
LTKGTSITKVKTLLQGLMKRYDDCRIDNQHQGIVVDNCCLLRNSVNEIFGPNIPVKLDIFDAIHYASVVLITLGKQRLTKQ